jgi:ACS family D-galactonate transporter-like MFS transporter
MAGRIHFSGPREPALVPWIFVAPKTRTASRSVAAYGGPGYREILKKREAWGTLLGLLCSNYAWYFMLTWLPQYLLWERDYSTRAMALIGWLPFCATAAGAVRGVWLSDAWIRRGRSPSMVRKGFCVTGLSVSAIFLLPAALATGQALAMSLLVLASFVFGLYTANPWAVTQTLAGVAAAGKWTGPQNCVGNLAGIVAPLCHWIHCREDRGILSGICLGLRAASSRIAFLPIYCPESGAGSWSGQGSNKSEVGAISCGAF